MSGFSVYTAFFIGDFMNDKVLSVLEYDKIISILMQYAVTQSGKKAISALKPVNQFKKVVKLLNETREAESIIYGNSSYPLSSFDEITAELGRLRMGASLSCAELLRVSRLMKTSKKAKASIKFDEEKKITILPDAADGLFYDDFLIGLIDKSIENEENVSDDASPQLRNIRKQIRNENSLIRERLNSIIRSNEFSKYLQDDIVTIRNGRFVVPVKQEFRMHIKGLVHGHSGSGATLFIEPTSVIEANNRINELISAENEEIERILSEISARFVPYIQELTWTQEILTYLDVVFAKASYAIKTKSIQPIICEQHNINIIKGRHPLINEKNVVPITLNMDKGISSLIITGPNTGGKTVTLKLIGLFVLMAQSGMFVPAENGTSFSLFYSVYADIGDEQSIEQSLSTFSSHMKSIIDIINNADDNSLVLLDELGAGTDPEEGASLAMAILKELSSRNLMLFATTHYNEIKAFALTNKGFMNASMEFDVNTLTPTYKLITGVSGSSNALLISSKLGMPEYVIDTAKNLMNQERLKFDDIMFKAEQSKKTAEFELEKADKLHNEALQFIDSAKKIEQEMNFKREKIIDNANKQALEIIKNAKEEAEKIISELKNARKASQSDETRIIEKTRKTISEKKNKLENNISVNKSKSDYSSASPKDLVLGDSVKIISLDVDAVVNKLPDSKGNVGVTAGIMQMNIHISDLAKVDKSIKKYERTSRFVRAKQQVSMSINITGKTVEEAYIELDKYIDNAYMSSLNEVSIIHGKGTGVLRAAVHMYLKKHPNVKSYRLGKFGEGEDGVTIVAFK